MKKEKRRINIDKPINIGTRVLNLCEGLMQDFHYNYIKNDYGDKRGILLTFICMKVKLKKFMKTSRSTESHLALVITQKITNIT